MSNTVDRQIIDDLAGSYSELKISYDSAKLKFDKVVKDLRELKKQAAALEECKVLLDGILAKIRGFYGTTEADEKVGGRAGNFRYF